MLIIKNYKNLALFLFLIFLTSVSGCAFVSHDIKLVRDFEIEQNTFGEGRLLKVVVNDHRYSDIVGYRHPNMNAGKLRIAGDVGQYYKEALEDGFRAKGFNPTDDENSDRSVILNIKMIDYTAEMNFSVDTTATVRLEITAQHHEQRYVNSYETKRSKAIAWNLTADMNRKLVNKSIDASLKAIFADEKLLTFLYNK